MPSPKCVSRRKASNAPKALDERTRTLAPATAPREQSSRSSSSAQTRRPATAAAGDAVRVLQGGAGYTTLESGWMEFDEGTTALSQRYRALKEIARGTFSQIVRCVCVCGRVL